MSTFLSEFTVLAPAWVRFALNGRIKRLEIEPNPTCAHWIILNYLWWLGGHRGAQISFREDGFIHLYIVHQIKLFIFRSTDSIPPLPCQHAMDIGIIVDCSGSVGFLNFVKTKNFVRNLVHRLKISSNGNRVGIIAYDSRARLVVKFAAVNSQTPSAMTNIINGYYKKRVFFFSTKQPLDYTVGEHFSWIACVTVFAFVICLGKSTLPLLKQNSCTQSLITDIQRSKGCLNFLYLCTLRYFRPHL